MNRKSAMLAIISVALGGTLVANLSASRIVGKAYGDKAAASGLGLKIPPNPAQRSLGAPCTGANESSGGHRYLYIQAVRYKPEVTTTQINGILRSLDETLRRIPQIKSIRSCHVAGDSRKYDYAILMEFDNLQDLKTYGSSEIHRRWVQEHNTAGLAQDVTRMTIDMNPLQ